MPDDNKTTVYFLISRLFHRLSQISCAECLSYKTNLSKKIENFDHVPVKKRFSKFYSATYIAKSRIKFDKLRRPIRLEQLSARLAMFYDFYVRNAKDFVELGMPMPRQSVGRPNCQNLEKFSSLSAGKI
uniref:Uncharacterized protein n=1 Tax=Romanomermis culicivorax TaxID=13658 RepID=A0A915IG81_ROMCU